MHLCEEHGVQRLYQVQDSTTAFKARVWSTRHCQDATERGRVPQQERNLQIHCQVQEELCIQPLYLSVTMYAGDKTNNSIPPQTMLLGVGVFVEVVYTNESIIPSCLLFGTRCCYELEWTCCYVW